MKKNLENNVSENIMIEPIMDEEQMKQYVDENLHMVPKNQQKRFDSLSLEGKVAKISFYYDMQKLREDARIKNSLPNKIKELFEKRGTVEDAKTIIQYCQSFIDNFKQKEIDKIDEQIRQLELMKQSL